MPLAKAISVRRLVSQAKSVDSVAEWLVELLLANVPEHTRLDGYIITAPKVEGARFNVQAHHGNYVCFYGHAVSGETVVGKFDLAEIQRDGRLGDPFFSFYVNDNGVFFADGISINQHFLNQEQYDGVRLEVAYQIMAAVQEHLPRYSAS
jgi:hypothetical protein